LDRIMRGYAAREGGGGPGTKREHAHMLILPEPFWGAAASGKVDHHDPLLLPEGLQLQQRPMLLVNGPSLERAKDNDLVDAKVDQAQENHHHKVGKIHLFFMASRLFPKYENFKMEFSRK